MPEELSIDINNDLLPFEDYTFLRSEGIKLIERLSGKVWTDYNAHDPGITLLEALCYTLTDLGYRTSFDIKDIITSKDEDDTGWNNVFHTARQILPSNPVTLIDYRKLIIDTEGVKNAWIETSTDYEVRMYLNAQESAGKTTPTSYRLTYEESDIEPLRIKGLYKITVEYEEDIVTENKQELVDATIKKKLNFHRNLCEDFLSIKPVEFELFKMEADVQVKEGFDIERINAKIFQVIYNFFSPEIKFYTLDQMIEKGKSREGYSIEEIFEGPALKNGFIDSEELEKSERYMDIHLSDIINLITDIPGVIAVKRCVFPIETQSAFSDFTQWITNVKEKEKAPRLDIENSIISFTRSGDRHRNDIEKTPDKERVRAMYYFLQSEKPSSKLKGTANDLPIPVGEFMNIAEYYPFQYSLPACYGMQEKIFDQPVTISVIKKAGDELKKKLQDPNIHISQRTEILESVAFENFGRSLSTLESTDELNKIKDQYSSYQLNQIKMANRQSLQLRGFLMVFEQIMADYLSQLANTKQLFSFDPGIAQTYFPQGLQNINDLEMLFVDFKKYQDGTLKLIETNKKYLNNRNKILDHLLARVGEDSNAYLPALNNADKDYLSNAITNKCRILSDYTLISGYRGTSFDYSNPDKLWDTDNVTGLKRRICRLLGINNFKTTFLTSDWISIEEVKQQGTVTGSKVVLKDPDNLENILLESKQFATESEIRQALKYMLESGFDKTLYNIDARRGKYSYELTRLNQEQKPEMIASLNLKSNPELETNFEKTLATLGKLSDIDNFHMLEHILLRPKINPQEAGKGNIKAEAVELLSITETPGDDFLIKEKQQITSYNFKIITVQNPDNNDMIWNLRLRKGQTVVMVAKDDFVFKSHLRKRIEHIRNVATDISNYKTIINKDGRSEFSITDREKVLAAGSKSYEKKEDMDQEITSLIKFFSFEQSLIEDQETESVDFNSYADPYSLRVSFFVPNWTKKFRDPGFRHLFEKAVYLETPAHIYPNVYWLNYEEMKGFEAVYKSWLHEIATNEIPDTAIVNRLLDVLNALRQSENND